jgi:hypothetical protein
MQRHWMSAIVVLVGLTGHAAAAERRTWTDRTGEFRVVAEFVNEKDGVVTLRRADGDEVEVPLEKLSAADQRVVKEAREAAAGNPFQSKSKSKGARAPAGGASDQENAGDMAARMLAGRVPGRLPRLPGSGPTGEEAAAVPPETRIDWSSAALVSPGRDGAWRVEPGAVPEPLAEPRSVAVPAKSNFFEEIKPLAVSGDGRKVALGYLLEKFVPVAVCRVVIADLETGKAAPIAQAIGKVAPLALHDDGAHLLARSEEFGFGNRDRLEVWRVADGEVSRLRSFVPYAQADGAARDIVWARFIDGEHFATAGTRELVVWRFPALEPVCRLRIDGVPALSPDRRLIAFAIGNDVALFDVATREVVARRSAPMPLNSQHFAFSPSGRRLACVTAKRLVVWDVATGEVIRDMDVPEMPNATGVLFPDEDWVLGGGQYLIGVESGVLLWTYAGQKQAAAAGPWTLFATFEDESAGAIVPLAIPHQAARDLLAKVANDPNLFVLRKGTAVRLDLDGIADAAARGKAAEDLTARLKAIGCTVEPAGTIVLAATVKGPEKKTLSLRNAGDFELQEWISALEFRHEGSPVWRTQSSNLPGGPVIFFQLEDGENIGTWLKKHEKPDYAFFNRVQLPRLLQRPAATGAPTGSLTLGRSTVTAGGLR